MASKTMHLQLDEGKIAYDDAGSGPLVLCSPGLGDFRSQFRFIAPEIAKQGFRVVTMDLRGMGDSDATFDKYDGEHVGKDMIALLRHLNAGPAVILGNSVSAGASIYAAAEAPDLVAALVPLSGFTRGPKPGVGIALLYVLMNSPARNSLWLSHYPTLFVNKPPDLQDNLAAIKAQLKQPARSKALKGMMLGGHAHSETRYARVAVPSLHLMGEKDPDFPDPGKEAREVAAIIHGESALIRGAGHYPHIEQPQQVLDHVLPFLAKVTTGVHK
mmetsp:Transcript_2958/g.8601  ORF Transcript_2958/g.8601 Transcript_2958/m.8601 type:complete len:272 (-) Transcript_2958:233-1048(-)